MLTADITNEIEKTFERIRVIELLATYSTGFDPSSEEHRKLLRKELEGSEPLITTAMVGKLLDEVEKKPIPADYFRVNGKDIPGQSIVEDAIRVLLRWVHEDPTRQGLKDTPARVARAWCEMAVGYQQDPKEILGTVFEQAYDEFILLRDIPFNSNCEHHLQSFSGIAHVGYIPQAVAGKVVGISKLARLVDCFAKRLQIQERLTKQIAAAIQEHLQPVGVAVVLKAEHSCIECRGVKKAGTKMVTSCMLGCFRDTPEARAEFLSLCQ